MVNDADLVDPALRRSVFPSHILASPHRICADPRSYGTTSYLKLINPIIPRYFVAALVVETVANASGKARTWAGALVLGDFIICSAVTPSP